MQLVIIREIKGLKNILFPIFPIPKMLSKIQTETDTDRVAVDVAGTGYSRGPTACPGLWPSSLPILYTDLHRSNGATVR